MLTISLCPTILSRLSARRRPAETESLKKKPRHNKPARECVPVTLAVGVENWVDVKVAIRHQWGHYPAITVTSRKGFPPAVDLWPSVIENEGIKRRPQTSTDSKYRYRKPQSEVA